MGQKPLKGKVKDPDATLGEVAAVAAARLKIAGAFECLNAKEETLSPEMRLADFPEDDITLASNLTPA
jgi:hypothetical protein